MDGTRGPASRSQTPNPNTVKRFMASKRIVLVTYGSLGDVQPMLALALGLKARGHDALLAGPPEKQTWAGELGCPFHPLGRDVTAFLNGMQNAHSVHSVIAFTRFLRSELKNQFPVLGEILAGADLAVGASLAFSVSSIAESLKIPYRYVAFTPQLLPSGRHPFPACRRQDWPPGVNRLTWRLARWVDRFNLTALLNSERRKRGLNAMGDAWRHILGPRVVVASDRAIARVPQDVESPVTQAGYLHLSRPKVYLPELERFLSEGPPPVYAGFGSMPRRDQERLTPLVASAARALGLRAVIARFWGLPGRTPQAEDIFFISQYPHAHLFPRMAAVIHHGGAGTTACAALSGVPQIIIPHILDQFYWGHRVHASGLGPEPVWRTRLSAEKLATALHECIANSMMKQTARSISSRIHPHESMERAVEALVGA